MLADLTIKIIIVGSSCTGKSCIMERFVHDCFSHMHNSTIGVDFAIQIVEVVTATGERKNCKLQIWDTAGQECFSAITQSYFNSAAGALLVYDVTTPSSLNDSMVWLQRLRSQCAETVEIVLVGNKIDSRDHWSVSTDTGQRTALGGGLPFAEMSAETGGNVTHTFQALAQRIFDRFQCEQNAPPRGITANARRGLKTMHVSISKSPQRKCCRS